MLKLTLKHIWFVVLAEGFHVFLSIKLKVLQNKSDIAIKFEMCYLFEYQLHFTRKLENVPKDEFITQHLHSLPKKIFDLVPPDLPPILSLVYDPLYKQNLSCSWMSLKIRN